MFPIAKYVYIEVMGMIYYAKYHRNGNSFIIAEAQDTGDKNKKALAQTLCRTDTGIGADALIVFDSSKDIISMVSYSKTGMRQPLNANGLACLVHYCYEYGFLSEKETCIKTDSTLVTAKIKKTTPFTTNIYLPPAVFSAKSCCMPESAYTEKLYINTSLGKIPITAVNTGSIYSVIWLDKQKQLHLNRHGRKLITGDRQYFIKKIAQEISRDSIFKLKTGIVFAEITEYNTISVKIYDKSSEFLASCLTAEAAAAVCALREGRCSGSNIVSGNTNIQISPEGIIKAGCVTYKATEGFVSICKK